MIRYKCTCAYVGAGYEGWQSQKRGNSIQEVIEEVVSRICDREVHITGSGRTDAGVSAREQVFHFDCERDMSERKWIGALNAFLPNDIHVTKVEKVSPRFHARYCVRYKKYTYRVNDGPYDVFLKDTVFQCNVSLDFEKMKEASAYYVGTHDFTALNSSSLSEYPDQTRTVFRVDLEKHGNLIEMSFYGKGFLRYMVRMMAAQLIEVGKGKLEPEDIKRILDSGSRTVERRNGHACGLTLEHVDYFDIAAMNPEGMFREYLRMDGIPEETRERYEEAIRNRTYPQYYNFTTRHSQESMGYMILKEDSMTIVLEKEEYREAAYSLEAGLREWLRDIGRNIDMKITYKVGE